MRSRIATVLLLNVTLSSCVTLDNRSTTITNKSKIELQPLLIECKLNDIAIVRVPEIREKSTLYYLYKPNGEIIRLYISDHQTEKSRKNNDINNSNLIFKDENYRLFSTDQYWTTNNTNDIMEENQWSMDALEFMMGPFAEDDYGNWILSLYYTDLKGDVVEMFQVISVEIVENVPAQPLYPKLNKGSTFKLRFAYPIEYLESCELRSPRSAGDRMYERDGGTTDCGYRLPNITADDAGVWTIIGVGKIVYKATVFLEVNNKNL
ncbi:uncharacterized protein [Battus philenor]|uniref:uncharacterized protein n=1 Tax=Battus philenor TaxID=42288 RepID=UPI0035CEDA57